MDAKKLQRICIFCGIPPVKKNNEHVIPQWLMALTGDPNRSAFFGFDFKKATVRRFALDQFQFPACEECNARFGRELEVPARRAMTSLLATNLLLRTDVEMLLDWMDKVRIGLWLGMRYLNQNLLGVRPNFHIANRIGMKDRALVLYRSSMDSRGLSFSGCETPAFWLAPTVFSLRVENYLFFSISSDYLIAQRAGLLRIQELKYVVRPNGQLLLSASIEERNGRPTFPLLPFSGLPMPSLRIFQPIVAHNPNMLTMVDDSRSNAELNLLGGVSLRKGPIYVQTAHGNFQLRDADALTVPAIAAPSLELMGILARATLEHQLEFSEQQLALCSDLPRELREKAEEDHKIFVRIAEIISNDRVGPTTSL